MLGWLFALTACLAAPHDDAWGQSPAAPRDDAAALRLPVARDVWVSSYPAEREANLGGAPRLKLKSYQEFALLDIDPEPLRGRVIRRVTLHLRHAADLNLGQVTVGTVAAPWQEGTSTDYGPEPGAASFQHRAHPDVPWTVPGSDLCDATLGNAFTLWRSAPASPPDADGWQTVEVGPEVLAARVAGVSHGFVLFDDTGSEWTRRGEEFRLRNFPHRYVHSRDAGPKSAPYLRVELGPEDHVPPGPIEQLRGDASDLPAGEAWLLWTAPADAGAGVIGFDVEVAGRPVPRYLIPRREAPGQPVRMRLRDLGLTAGAEVDAVVWALDGAGNAGPRAAARVRVSDRAPLPTPPAAAETTSATAAPPAKAADPAGAAWPRLGTAQVLVLDELEKWLPQAGQIVPTANEAEPSRQRLYDAAQGTVRLAAARGEHAAFQVLVRGPAAGLTAELAWTDEGPPLAVELGRVVSVPSAAAGPIPDVVVPLEAPATGNPTPADAQTVWVEVFVPTTAAAGPRAGALTLRAGGAELRLPVELSVWNFTLPDVLSFLPEMNCYGLPDNARDFYRLAHRHRTVLNRVPYHHNGSVKEGCAPALSGGRFDWSAWDARFGPLFDGSAFADLPRAGVPLEGFYLPVFENWPVPIADHYNETYWAHEAFTADYRAQLVDTFRQFAEHFAERGWRETRFQFYLNGKHNFKERGWSRGTCPWLLDEPAHFQDFWALRWFGDAFHAGLAEAGGDARLLFRADISRPQWQRDVLDRVVDYNVVGSALRSYTRIVMDRREACQELVLEYGSANAPEASNTQPVGWCLDAWTLGCDGVVPWQTMGRAESWTEADPYALLYPAADGGSGEPRPSLRLKAFRRGQQDVEYLVLWMLAEGAPRWAVARTAREFLGLAGTREGTGLTAGEDAGRVSYANLSPARLRDWRWRLGARLNELAPPPRRQLVDRQPPRRGVPRGDSPLLGGPAAGRTVVDADAPAVVTVVAADPSSPRATGDPATARTILLSGPAQVDDALVSFELPEQAFGGEARSNPLRRTDRVNALLVRFDLDALELEPDDVLDARLGFSVWDPASIGTARMVVRPVLEPWSEAEVTWQRATGSEAWSGGQGFDVARHLGGIVGEVRVPPLETADVADPPLAYEVDVTPLVRDWLSGRWPNRGLSLGPVVDRTVDEGHNLRLQVLGSEHRDGTHGPRLTIRARGK